MSLESEAGLSRPDWGRDKGRAFAAIGRCLAAGVIVILPAFPGAASAQSATRLVLLQGRSRLISRPSNPSTGFSWTIAIAPDGVVSIADLGYRPPTRSIPGRAGTQAWRVTALIPGAATITLRYARPWETDGQTKLERIIVTVRRR